MSSISIILVAVLALIGVVNLVLLVLLWRRAAANEVKGLLGEIAPAIAQIGPTQERIGRDVRGEFANARNESAQRGQMLREEISTGNRNFTETMLKQMTALAGEQRAQFEAFTGQLRHSASDAAQRQAEVAAKLDATIDALNKSVALKLDGMKAESGLSAQALKKDTGDALSRFGAAIQEQMSQLFSIQASQHTGLTQKVDALTEGNRQRGEELRAMVETQLTQLRTDNEKKLDQMRHTVDEKLQGALEKRLGDSFKIVSERLEAVHKGLGEVQSLATGVGDLKRVLSNVKTRGSWGEVALGNLLEQLLTAEQFVANAQVKEHSGERVEYAIRLPGRDDGDGEVLLPIDAKFPMEDYERLQQAADAGDRDAVEASARALEGRIRAVAKDIASKYVNPPRTTDFALMFLPTEGLFAEVIRRPGLCDDLQREHRVAIAGPTTLAALLNALQMGFRTLTIQRRSSEVWQVLAAVKTEFDKFGPVLEKVKKKLEEATNTIDQAGRRERVIKRRLKGVEAMPAAAATGLLGIVADEFGEEGDEAVAEPALS